MIDDNAIIHQLATLLTPITSVAAIYEGIPVNPSAFPFIAIHPLGWTDTALDHRDNTVEASYIISVYVSLGTTALTAQSTLRGIVKEVVTILGDQANIDLGQLVDFTQFTSGEYGFDQKDSSLYFCNIQYKVKKNYSRYS